MAVRPVKPTIIILTKDPIPGRVKTRLIPALGVDGATRLHEAMVHETIRRAQETGWPVEVSLDGQPDGPFAMTLKSTGGVVRSQAHGDLGSRLAHALQGPGWRIALGSDCVVFDPTWLVRLATCEEPIAIGPSEDGGYWTISIEAANGAVFDTVFSGMPWSSSELLDVTLERLDEAGIPRTLLPHCYDVDDPDDLKRLVEDPRCPASIQELVATFLR